MIAAQCQKCGVMGGCICVTAGSVTGEWPSALIPEEPARENLPASPSQAYREGYREGFVDGFAKGRDFGNPDGKVEGEEA